MAKKTIEFYGTEGMDCMVMDPKVEKLEKEDGVAIESLEVWHNEANKRKMASLRDLYDKECRGNFVVPSFYDPETHRLICGPGTYENLRAWVFHE